MSDASPLFELPGALPRDSLQAAGDQSSESTGDADGHSGDDAEMEEVVNWFRGRRDMVTKFELALRQAIDEVLDGQRTGRYDVNDLEKTEKTYLGTKVEIVVRAAFELPRGERMDYKVAGHDIDSKFTSLSNWTIPTEAMGHLCLLTAADDHKGVFNVGVIRIDSNVLNSGQNKDSKKTLSKAGRDRIVWLARGARLPENLLLSLPRDDVAAIMGPRSGQQRINELLRRVQGRLIERTTAVTVAKQADGLKRCRDARSKLAPEGIVVLGHQNESPIVARALNLPVPPKGSFLSVRLAPTSPDTPRRRTVELHGRAYAVARPEDPIHPAPPIKY